MFGFVPTDDPLASDEERLFPANLALDVIAARRLGQLRRRLGLSQADVAKAAESLGLDWTRNSVHAIERFGFGGRPEPRRGQEPEASVPRPTANPQSGTRRLTLMELFVVPQILARACEVRGGPSGRIHPLWFVERETYERMRPAWDDPAAAAATWSSD